MAASGKRSSSGEHTIWADEVDEFVYAHPDCLVIFTAGNDGKQDATDHAHIQLGSLHSPATAKNALTVGACGSPRPDGTGPPSWASELLKISQVALSAISVRWFTGT